MPSPGRVKRWIAPGGPGIRTESHLFDGYVVPTHYDSLVAKLLAHGRSRDEAIRRLSTALKETTVEGFDTTIPLHEVLMREPGFMAGGYNIHHLEHCLENGLARREGA